MTADEVKEAVLNIMANYDQRLYDHSNVADAMVELGHRVWDEDHKRVSASSHDD